MLQSSRMFEKNILKERDANSQLSELLSLEETMRHQRSRINLTFKNDRCTKFFFLSTVIHRRRNVINYINDDHGLWLDNRNDIGSALTQKYQLLFSFEGSNCLVELDGLALPKVDLGSFPSMHAISTDEEIKEILFQMGLNKALGIDGMQCLFFRTYRPIVKLDVYSTI